MTEIKQVDASVRSLSFHFFFSPSKRVLEQGGGSLISFWREGLYHYNGAKCFFFICCLSCISEVTKSSGQNEGGRAGWCLIAIKFSADL